MSDIKLFPLSDGTVAQLAGSSVAVEKSLQHLIEPGDEPEGDSRLEAIGEAARRLDDLRRNWLNPEGAYLLYP